MASRMARLVRVDGRVASDRFTDCRAEAAWSAGAARSYPGVSRVMLGVRESRGIRENGAFVE